MQVADQQTQSPDNRANKRDIVSVLPATSGQKALWAFCQSQAHYQHNEPSIDLVTETDRVQSNSTDTEFTDSGLLQARFDVKGSINQALFNSAWQMTCEQFEALRTTVHPHHEHEILLVCRKSISTNVVIEDWSTKQVAEQNTLLKNFLESDRLVGIDLTTAPSSRLQCFLLSDNQAKVVWTCHHLLLDGWSAIVIINTFLSNYACLFTDAQCPTAELCTYSHYRQWISSTNRLQSEDFWKNELSGYFHPTLICPSYNNMQRNPRNRLNSELLSEKKLNDLKNQCKDFGLTIASTMQSAWLLVVAGICDTKDLTIGVSVAGRPDDLPGIETTAGFLANIIPVRGQLDFEGSISDWLIEMQTRQFESREHDHLPLPDILSMAEPGCRGGCFDHLLVIENLPSLNQNFGPLLLENYESGVVSGFPLTVTLVPGDQLSITIDFSAQHYDTRWIEELGDAFGLTLSSLLSEPDISLSSYLSETHSKINLSPIEKSDPRAFKTDAEIGERMSRIISPKSNIELDVLGLFEEVLQQHSLSMDDDFFDRGGKSIQGLKLIALIEQKFGRRVPVIELIKHRTPLALAKILRNDAPDHAGVPSLIPLQQNGSQPGLFCLHAGGGHALFYTEFARQLGGTRPIFALQPRGIDGFEKPLNSIEKMAAHYVDEIIQQQPEGPYHLMGHCFSGALVPEMARQLDNSGKSVGHLIITDAAPPMPATHIMSMFGWTAYRAYETLFSTPPSKLLSNLATVTRNRFVNFNAGFKSNTGTTTHRNTGSSEELSPSHLVAVQKACIRAVKTYRAEPCLHKLTILTSIDEHGNTVRELDMKNWRKFAPNHEAIYLPVDHQTIFFDPEVRIIGKFVADLLDTPSTNRENDQGL